MTIQRIKYSSYLLLPQPLPQPLSKLIPFPAILFVRPPSVRISLGGGIHPRIFGIVLVTVPRGNNHLSRPDVPENYLFGRLEPCSARKSYEDFVLEITNANLLT
ncbi:MAG: hypothetical protein WAN75_06750 [Xanthobacteraceae bacterium]